ncbi:class II aldolase/adducin family protein [Alkalibacter rhizosphaerae]|uniref:Class II aldolase/adducin family protein n=1 Tax=Alkalibacter rhizosphaerae TaxID=2815577 RepID=A0A974XID5_9FIRM|nr:class II aldolase/adducin family protein [Alkalibacter rhizosphaerae]QSX09245.1 class II aldolase/adducin family protein [Alkalibacter rhizosphaerae]
MYENEKREVIKAGITMDRYGLIALSGGNVSVRMPNNDILVTPSGMIYEEMVVDDVLVVDLEGNVLEGTRKPSVDTKALLYIFKKRPEINAVVHTHQPYATAVGLVQDELPCVLTTLANTTKGSVKVAKYSSAASLDMGIDTVEAIGDRLAIILKHHGVVAIGKSLKEALYASIYLEEAAKTYIAAKTVGDVAVLDQEQVDQAVEVFKYYGQGTADLPEELTMTR